MRRFLPHACALFCALFSAAAKAQEEAPLVWRWVQPEGTEPAPQIAVRARFDWPEDIQSARLLIAADNRYDVYWRGHRIAVDIEWRRGRSVDLPLVPGKASDVLVIRGKNEGGPAGLLLRVEVTRKDGRRQTLLPTGGYRGLAEEVTGWMEEGFDDASWPLLQEIAPFGAGPWGLETRFLPPESFDFDPRPGFSVHLLADGIGSLISLTRTEDGDPIVGVETGGVLRLKDQDADGRFETAIELAPELQAVQGLLVQKERLWMVGTGPKGHGLYARKLEDPKSRLEHFGRFGGTGEHGPHAVVEDARGRLWIALGNHTPLLEPKSSLSPYRSVGEGHPLPLRVDPLGHATQIRAPGGTIVCFDPASGEWFEVFGGLRNAYDIDFDAAGRLFTYDSDMEWDIGLPWYRPTRFLHLVPGGENGWRTGSSKWPAGRVDAWPVASEAGRGSPTGVLSGHRLNFPAPWSRAILGGDWAQGRILAFLPDQNPERLAQGTTEVLLAGRPLNITDMVASPRGDLWFTCGGRASRGALFALRYAGQESAAKREAPSESRPKSEQQPARLTAAFRLFDHDFRADRPAPPRAEILQGLAGRDPALWQLALMELRRAPLSAEERGELSKSLRGALAVAFADREQGVWPSDAALAGWLQTAAAPDDLAAVLRLVQWACMATPTDALTKTRAALAALPWPEERLSFYEAVLAAGALKGESLQRKLLDLLARETDFARRILIADALSACGPLADEALPTAVAFARAAAGKGGGRSQRGFITAILGDLAGPDEDRQEELLDALNAPGDLAPAPLLLRPDESARIGAHDPERLRAYVHAALPEARRNAAIGAYVYEVACARCHQFGENGNGLGPDLTTVRGRFAVDDLADAIFYPSRVISDQYQSRQVTTTRGPFFGALLREDQDAVELLRTDGVIERIARPEIESIERSRISAMPGGLLDAFNPEEVADLFHYLLRAEAAPSPDKRPWTRVALGLERMPGGDALGLFRAEGAPWAPFVLGDDLRDFRFQVEVRLKAGSGVVRLGAKRSGEELTGGLQVLLGGVRWASLGIPGAVELLQVAPEVDWRPHFAPGGWNHLLVEVRGTKIRTALNGIPGALYEAKEAPRGALAIMPDPGAVLWLRNAAIRNLD